MRTLRRRLLMPRYEKCEYVYNNGAYIDTGLPEGDYIFKAKIATLQSEPHRYALASSGRATGNTDRYYCAVNNNNGATFGLKVIYQGCGATFDNINVSGILDIQAANVYEFQLGIEPNTYWCKINGKYFIYPKQGKKKYSDRTVKVFYNYYFLSYGKIYFAKIFSSDGKTLIRDYAPAIDKTRGEAGLLERVQGKFYHVGTNGIEFTKP